MSDRFNPIRVARAAVGGLKDRRRRDGARDLAALGILFGIPLLMTGISVTCGWVLRKPDSLIAGFALLSAALVALIPQLVTWRGELSRRASRFEEIPASRLDEAVANVLFAALVSVFLTILAVVMSNTIEPAVNSKDTLVTGWGVWLTGILVAGGSLLVLEMVLIVNLLWDSYLHAQSVDDRMTKESRAA